MHASVAPVRVLALDAAAGLPSAALVTEAGVAALCCGEDPRGAPAGLAGLVARVLADAPGPFDAVAVTVGPGSFTGLRAAIALAHGLGLGAGVPVLGVSVAEAVEALLPPGCRAWVVGDTKRGRWFFSRDGAVEAVDPADMPWPDGPVLLAGDMAEAAATRLAGSPAMLSAVRGARADGVGLAGLRRLAGLLPPLPAQPLYGEAPEARPAATRRPAPV